MIKAGYLLSLCFLTTLPAFADQAAAPAKSAPPAKTAPGGASADTAPRATQPQAVPHLTRRTKSKPSNRSINRSKASIRAKFSKPAADVTRVANR